MGRGGERFVKNPRIGRILDYRIPPPPRIGTSHGGLRNFRFDQHRIAPSRTSHGGLRNFRFDQHRIAPSRTSHGGLRNFRFDQYRIAPSRTSHGGLRNFRFDQYRIAPSRIATSHGEYWIWLARNTLHSELEILMEGLETSDLASPEYVPLPELELLMEDLWWTDLWRLPLYPQRISSGFPIYCLVF